MDCSAIVLAAGRSKRIGIPYPKVLLPINRKPVLSYLIKTLQPVRKISEIIIVVSKEVQEEMRRYLRFFRLKNLSIIIQPEPMGTGHALRTAINQVKENKKIIVLCGDTPLIKKETIERIIEKEQATGAEIVITTAFLKKPFGYGRIVRNKLGQIMEIVEEKNASGTIRKIKEVNGGIYLFDLKKIAPLLENLCPNRQTKEYYLTDIIKMAIKDRMKVESLCVDGKEIKGINIWVDYEEIKNELETPCAI